MKLSQTPIRLFHCFLNFDIVLLGPSIPVVGKSWDFLHKFQLPALTSVQSTTEWYVIRDFIYFFPVHMNEVMDQLRGWISDSFSNRYLQLYCHLFLPNAPTVAVQTLLSVWNISTFTFINHAWNRPRSNDGWVQQQLIQENYSAKPNSLQKKLESVWRENRLNGPEEIKETTKTLSQAIRSYSGRLNKCSTNSNKWVFLPEQVPYGYCVDAL